MATDREIYPLAKRAGGPSYLRLLVEEFGKIALLAAGTVVLAAAIWCWHAFWYQPSQWSRDYDARQQARERDVMHDTPPPRN